MTYPMAVNYFVSSRVDFYSLLLVCWVLGVCKCVYANIVRAFERNAYLKKRERVNLAIVLSVYSISAVL